MKLGNFLFKNHYAAVRMNSFTSQGLGRRISLSTSKQHKNIFLAIMKTFVNSLINICFSQKILFVSFSCHDSYSPRGPEQHRMIGFVRTALSRTAPYISSWIFHQSKGSVSLFIILCQPASMGTCYDLTILITNYLCSIYYSLGTPLYYN